MRGVKIGEAPMRAYIPKKSVAHFADGYPLTVLRARWCECGECVDGPFVDDDGCVCGIRKHHMHCLKCGCLTQIG